MTNRDLVDLHNHILYGLDDGAANLEESLDIARQFVAEGVTRIAATPHFSPDNPPGERGADAAEVRSRVAHVQAALKEVGIPLSVVPGNEVYLTPEAPALLASGTVCCLGGSNTVLVELSLLTGDRPLYVDDLVFRLQLSGYRVVLAHPERYGFVERDETVLDTLVAGGLLLQLTAPSLLGDYDRDVKRTAEHLLRRGAYSLAASDRHHPGPQRSLVMLHERVSALTNSETADILLCTNPARVLDNEPTMEIEPPITKQPSFLERILGQRGS